MMLDSFCDQFILFVEIKTVECLCNSFDVRTVPLPEARFNTEVSFIFILLNIAIVRP